MRSQSVSSVLTLVSFLTLGACGSGAGADPSAPPDETRPQSDAGVSATTGTPGATTPSSAGTALLTMAVPAGVGCIVATMTGSTALTVSTTIAAGATTATLNFGVVNPGVVTVVANAYASSCPATGPATWVGDPVQATVIAGETLQIPLVLHAAASAVGVVTFDSPAVAIATEFNTTYAVLADGTVRAWGASNSGEFGNGAVGTWSATPVTVAGVSNAIQIAAGGSFACAIRSPDHSVICWGADTGSNLSFPTFPGTTPNLFEPPTVQTGVYAAQISACTYGFGLVGLDGTLGWFFTYQGGSVTWVAGTKALSVAAECSSNNVQNTQAPFEYVTPGGQAAGLLGASGTAPSAIAYPATAVYEGIDGSGQVGCAVLLNGGLSCWGNNLNGMTGTGGSAGTTQPGSAVAVPGFGPGGQQVASMGMGKGSGFACLVTRAGTVYCTGSNGVGQLGNGTVTSSPTYTQVPGLANVVQVAAGYAHACALKADGSMACWGANDSGQLGDGTVTTRFSPVNVVAW